ncbi:heme exporter protein CcmB [Acidocella sp.]|uniref:heme exporter protein CcmB n=1 Tax=Acidocella sp. TaxID=50710 RepID=UPI002616D499|nr:heme exporter protein CcmB [Acidocella sp.]
MRALIAQDLKLSLRQGADSAAALVFFIIAGSLFAFAVGPAPGLLARLAAGVVWVCALLAALLPLDRVFAPDFEDGTLDVLLLSGLPAYEIAFAKALTHWLTTGLPLLLIAPVLAVMLRLPGGQINALLASLVPGTMIFSLLGTFSAAVTLGARRASVLMPVITLPLMIPALIFGASVAGSAHPAAAFYMLGAILAAALPLAPLGAGLALRAASE